MPHTANCSRSREHRSNLADIIDDAYNETGIFTCIAEALQLRFAGEDHTYYCPDTDCRTVLTPRKLSRNIPIVTKQGIHGFFDRRAHFACEPKGEIVQGKKRREISRRQSVIDMIASRMRASGLYDLDLNGKPIVYTNAVLQIDINRRKQTEIHQAGWGHFVRYPVDIIATRRGIDVIIQVEEDPIRQRYGNSAHYITRVKRLADTKTDKRKYLVDSRAKSIKDVSRRVYQTSVVLQNQHFYLDNGGRLSDTEVVMLAGFYDTLNVFNLENNHLLVVDVTTAADDENIQGPVDLENFGFIETQYDKRFQRQVFRRNRKVTIPHLSIAQPVKVLYDQQTGRPLNQDMGGQTLFNFG